MHVRELLPPGGRYDCEVQIRAARAAIVESAAMSIAEHAGSVQLAIDDAANQLAGLSERTAAGWGQTRE